MHAMNGVLRAAALHESVLQEEGFRDLGGAVGGIAAFDRLAILVPDAPLSFRVQALSLASDEVMVLGARLPGEPAVWRRVIEEQLPHITYDMRAGGEAERVVARGGMCSYGAFPVRVGQPEPRVVAVMVLAFRDPGAARDLPLGLLQEVADIIGPSVERGLAHGRERRLAMILDTSGDALLAWDREGRVCDANASAEGLSGRSRGELLGARIVELLDPPPALAVAGDGDAPASRRVRLSLLSRGGARIPVSATITAVSGDPVVAAHALLRDLTEVVRAEREAVARLSRIRELEEQHRTLLDNAPLIIFRLDPATGELVYLNRHAERLLGIPPAEALATPGFLRAAHADPQGVAAFDAAVERARAGGLSLPYEARLRRRGRDEITARGTIYPLLANGRRVAAVEGMLADVSAEHAARSRLVEADRLSTLGMLAAGVAHEINNPAAFILLGLDLLDRMLAGPGIEAAEGASTTVRELRESIRRIVDLARDLRLFASPPSPDSGRPAIVDVNRTVEAALCLTRGQVLERAQLDRQLQEVPPVLMEDGRLGQVVVNLLVNAAQAIQKAPERDHKICVSTRSDGRTVEIDVSDTGVGIPAENMQRIWQPFFTTKQVNEGSGLGLSISREIVERAGGTILAESPAPGSSPPCGTRFAISLPAAWPDAPEDERSSPVPPEPPRSARVLIVEDEAALARALAEELGRQHEIAVALGGEAALARLAEERFDAVLCDLRMPGMSGEALYARVRQKDETQARAFIFMAGVGFGPEVEKLLAESGRPMLEKPFPAAVALEAIARVVRQRG